MKTIFLLAILVFSTPSFSLDFFEEEYCLPSVVSKYRSDIEAAVRASVRAKRFKEKLSISFTSPVLFVSNECTEVVRSHDYLEEYDREIMKFIALLHEFGFHEKEWKAVQKRFSDVQELKEELKPLYTKCRLKGATFEEADLQEANRLDKKFNSIFLAEGAWRVLNNYVRPIRESFQKFQNKCDAEYEQLTD